MAVDAELTPASSEPLDWERLATNLRLERALLDALDVIGDVPVVVFKGTALTQRIYGDLRKRASADNDLLVRRADAALVLSRLLEHGYRAAPGRDAQRALERDGQVAVFPQGDGDLPSLDLHIEPFSRSFFRVADETIWSRLEPFDVHGRTLQTFDAALTLLHMVAHFFQHLLEPHMLVDLGAAWDRFGHTIPAAELAELADLTVGRAPLEYALGLAASLGHSCHTPSSVVTQRARLALRWCGAAWLQGSPRTAARGLVSLLLVGPERLPRALWRGFFPEKGELSVLYGEGSHTDLLFRHWRHRLRD